MTLSTDTPQAMSFKPGRGNIYFAHPYSTWKTEMEKKIADTLKQRGWRVINPFDSEVGLLKKYGVECYYDKPGSQFAWEIFSSDEKLVRECDAYFGWFDHNLPMVGTSIELAWAYEMNKHIIIVSDKLHPFLISMADTFYPHTKAFLDNKSKVL